MLSEKSCEFCGQLFVPKSNVQKYCKGPHYMICPICNKSYLVTNNENLKRPPVACSYACRAAETRTTSLERYGIAAPGNNPKARAKAKQTMQEKYKVDYTLQSNELRIKASLTIKDRYGVDNIQKLVDITQQTQRTKYNKWIEKVHTLLPMKLDVKDKAESVTFNLDDSQLSIFILTEQASIAFLQKYGINKYSNKFRRIHLSLGLVNDGILYQVVRFEKVPNSDKIVLANFGTRANYIVSNYYTKLINFAVQIKGIEEFDAYIPRNIARKEIIESMSLKLIELGQYEVYWKIKNDQLNMPDKYAKLNRNDNIEEMLETHDYVTTDYIDKYSYEYSYECNKEVSFHPEI